MQVVVYFSFEIMGSGSVESGHPTSRVTKAILVINLSVCSIGRLSPRVSIRILGDKENGNPVAKTLCRRAGFESDELCVSCGLPYIEETEQ